MTTDPRALDDVGAVVVTHARIDLAASAVATLRGELPRDRLVVVVNLAAVLEDERARGLDSDARLIAPPRPQGYGANLNLGVGALPPEARFVVLANDDVLFGSGAVRALVDVLRRRPRVGLVGAALVDAAGTPLPSTGSFPTALDAFVRSTAAPARLSAFARRVDERRQIRRRERDPQDRSAATEPSPDWVVGAAMAVRREAFAEVGGFDEDFFMYFEETDFAYRLRRLGWTVASSAATVTHIGGQSTGEERYAREFRRGRRLFLRKRLGRSRWLLLETLYPLIFAVAAASSALEAAPRRRLAAAGAGVRRAWAARVFWIDRFFG